MGNVITKELLVELMTNNVDDMKTNDSEVKHGFLTEEQADILNHIEIGQVGLITWLISFVDGKITKEKLIENLLSPQTKQNLAMKAAWENQGKQPSDDEKAGEKKGESVKMKFVDMVTLLKVNEILLEKSTGKLYQLKKESFGSCKKEDEKTMVAILNKDTLKTVSYTVFSIDQILSDVNDWEVYKQAEGENK
ncbi:hypothetical protein A374_08669 [Fictibacillus macauensis ZFHKF-1]|uniref:Uncharacterized protein n=1 Tax=Fictibacillus macauensis ZFHKF-1 TaxID=1196324 RepID=I8UG65_9BACL|nr:hypothetical protein [Fictibacillus macauensis]EIT85895.1 hypothetical protein A374_08669 [Fictibacillus macauensis ZFHKF-1]